MGKLIYLLLVFLLLFEITSCKNARTKGSKNTKVSKREQQKKKAYKKREKWEKDQEQRRKLPPKKEKNKLFSK